MKTWTFTEATHQLSTGTYVPGVGWRVHGHHGVLSGDDITSEVLPACDSASTFVMLCIAGDDAATQQQVLAAREHFGRSAVLISRGTGVMHGGSVVGSGLSVAAMKLNKASLRSAFVPVMDRRQSRAAGMQLGLELSHPGLRAVAISSNVTYLELEDVIEGLRSQLQFDSNNNNNPITFFGAGSAAGIEYDDDAGVRAIGFYGPSLKIGCGARLGVEGFGPQRVLNNCEGTLVHQIDGKPALDIYKRILGPRAAELPGSALLFPLLIKTERGVITRSVVGVDEASGAIRLAASLPESNKVQLARAEFDSLIHAGADAAWEASEGAGHGGACLAVTLACAGRHMLLGQRANEEANAVMMGLPLGSAQVGCYTGPIIAPHLSTVQVMGQAIGMLTIREEL